MNISIIELKGSKTVEVIALRIIENIIFTKRRDCFDIKNFINDLKEISNLDDYNEVLKYFIALDYKQQTDLVCKYSRGQVQNQIGLKINMLKKSRYLPEPNIKIKESSHNMLKFTESRMNKGRSYKWRKY